MSSCKGWFFAYWCQRANILTLLSHLAIRRMYFAVWTFLAPLFTAILAYKSFKRQPDFMDHTPIQALTSLQKGFKMGTIVKLQSLSLSYSNSKRPYHFLRDASIKIATFTFFPHRIQWNTSKWQHSGGLKSAILLSFLSCFTAFSLLRGLGATKISAFQKCAKDNFDASEYKA